MEGTTLWYFIGTALHSGEVEGRREGLYFCVRELSELGRGREVILSLFAVNSLTWSEST